MISSILIPIGMIMILAVLVLTPIGIWTGLRDTEF